MKSSPTIDPPRSPSPAGVVEPTGARDPLVADALGWLVAAIGAVILAGWIADLPVLRNPVPGQIEVKANTAICFLLSGLALALQRHATLGSLARASAGLVAGFSLLILLQYPAGRNWGLDELFIRDVVDAEGTVHPGRMAAPTALNFVLLGSALLLLRTRWLRIAATLAFSACSFAVLAFLGTLYNLPFLVAFGPYTAMAAPTGATFLLLGVGVLLAVRIPLVGRARSKALAIGLTLAFVVLALLGGAVVRNIRLLTAANRQVVHTHEVLAAFDGLLITIHELDAGVRGYLISGDAHFLEPVAGADGGVRRQLAALRALTAGDPRQQERLARLEELVAAKIHAAERQVELHRGGDAAAQALVTAGGEGHRLVDAIRELVDAARTDERALLAVRQARTKTGTARTLLALGSGLAFSVVLLGAVFGRLRREITVHTRLAAALRRSEESLAVTLNSIGDGVLATDTDGRITLLNPVAEQLTGWDLAAARGRPVAEVFRIVHEQTRQPAPIPVESVLATGEIRGLANHTVLIGRDGGERAIADSAAPIRDAEGRILGVVLVFRDVTESRRAQAQLDRFFELSLDFLCIASMDGYFKRASPAVTDILGWTVDEFLAQPFMEQIHPDDRESAAAEVRRQAAGEKVMHYECRFRHKDGSWRTLSWRSVPYAGFMYATARDVTEAREAEARVRALNRLLRERATQLESANQELEAFSYSVSHDLRAPLRHVQGYVEMLAREAQGTLSEKSQRYLRTIADAAREMGTLIDDLLAFSRMGRAEMSETDVDPVPLVDEVRQAVTREAAGRDIRWTIEALPRVRADVAMLRQVFINLLGNAVKYTRRREVAEIAVACTGAEEGRVVFCVRDNGAGFDMKYADKLFGVFQRLHRADEFEGTGIGLASVRRIIARHGGRTWADGRVAGGAAFYFTLQTAAPPAPPPAP
jgi:PAS domain S-box-containing protein